MVKPFRHKLFRTTTTVDYRNQILSLVLFRCGSSDCRLFRHVLLRKAGAPCTGVWQCSPCHCVFCSIRGTNNTSKVCFCCCYCCCRFLGIRIVDAYCATYSNRFTVLPPGLMIGPHGNTYLVAQRLRVLSVGLYGTPYLAYGHLGF